MPRLAGLKGRFSLPAFGRVVLAVAAVAAAVVVVLGSSERSGSQQELNASGLPTRQSVAVAAKSSPEERQRSQRIYRGLGDRPARDRVRRAFGGYLHDKGWRDLRDQRDVKVQRYLDRQAAVVKLADGTQALVRSLLPLTAGKGKRSAPLDTTVSSSNGTWRPRRALNSYAIAGESGPGPMVSFRRSGIDVSLATSVPLSASEGARQGASLVYPNVARDADAVLKAMPAGVQVAFAIRSPASPQSYRLKLALRAGDVLRAAVPGAKDATGGPEGGVVVLRGGRGALSVGVPAAVDSDGRNLSVDTRVEDDTVVYKVDHRDADIHYPILLDPYVAEDQRYWFLNGAVDFNGWQFASNAPGMFGALADYNSAFGRGLYIYTATGINYPSGAKASWSFTAPTVPGYEAEGARIIKADYGYTGHYQALNGGSCLTEGIYRPTLTSYEPGAIWRGAQATDSYTAYDPAYGMYNCNAEGVPGTPATYGYRVHCLSVCGNNDGGNETLGTPGNTAVLGMLQGAGYQARGGIVFMGSSLIFETEQSPPRVTASAAPSGWTDQPFTINATSTDYGLGVSNLTMTAGGQTLASAQQASPCTDAGLSPPEGGTPGSANVGDRNHRCTAPLSTSIASSALSEGAADVTISSQDILANGTTTTTTPRIDRTPPTITPSGSLNDARDGFIGPNQDYILNVTATDGSLASASTERSGATSLSATLDGIAMTDGSVSAPCTRPEGSCSLQISTTLTASEIQELDDTITHTIAITATDALGHATTPTTFTFKVDSVSPASFSDGDLSQLSGRTLSEDSYRLRVEARDNEPFQPEMDDNSDETPPIFNQPGAGLRDLVIRLDGQTVATTTTSCFDDPACEDSRVWQWDTTSSANGTHTITVAAADKVGNQEIDSFEIDLQRAADQPARTTSTVRRTVLGARGGDRTGAAVAALGDVNGDGYADYAVGAPNASPSGRSAAGTATILLGTADTSTIDLANPGTAAQMISGPGSGQYCGTSVAAAGDVNGDGFADMLVGCPGIDTSVGALTKTGRVYVVFGSSAPQDVDLATLGTAGFVITGPIDTYVVGVPLGLLDRTAIFGERLQSSPPDQTTKDVNDDGLDDIVIGDSNVPQGDNGYAGAVYVIYGKTDSQTIDATAPGNAGYVIRGAAANSLSGYSAVIAGDLNGDTFADIVIGAPGRSASTGGRAYIVNGAPYDNNGARSNTDVDLNAPTGRAVTLTSGDATGRFGVTVSALGDTNLDDTPDVAIGTSSGAYVLRKIPTTSRQISADDGYRITGPTNQPSLLSTQIPAAPISAAGDLDGDERADIIIGYPDTSGARAYTVRSPEAARTINVASLPGQRGAAITTGTQADGAGAAVAANSYQGTTPVSENAQAIIGAPNAAADSNRSGAGRAYILSEPTPSGPGVDPLQPPTTQASVATTRSALAIAATSSLFDPKKTPIPGLFHILVNNALNTRWATVRNDVQLLVIGSGANLQPVYADDQRHSRDRGSGGKYKLYVHGRLEGDINRCGWVIGDKVVGDDPDNPNQGTAFPTGASPKRPCSKKRRLAPRAFASLVNCDACNDGSPVRLRRRDNGALPARIPIYRNVRPGTQEGKYSPDGTIPTITADGERTTVNWRYITKSGGFVLVRASNRNVSIFGHNKWAFIERKYLPHTAGMGGLCDNTEGGPPGPAPAGPDDDPGTEFLNYNSEPAVSSPRRLDRGDWSRVCSHRKYNVPDNDGPS